MLKLTHHKIAWLMLAWCAVFSGFSQTSNIVQKEYPVLNDTLQLSPLGVQPELIIKVHLNHNQYRIDSVANLIIVAPENNVTNLTLTHRTLSIGLDTAYYEKPRDYITRFYQDNPFNYTPSKKETQAEEVTLSTVGNISRGIGFGNKQDVVVNSNLNLRLTGKISDDININAVISDESNPIQPEGNTQQLQDFDQVYINLKSTSTSITLGDFIMQSDPNDYFRKYYKRSRGLQMSHRIHLKDQSTLQLSSDLALARGRFNRNTIQGQEGNRGPYRLSGANGELFIIVISGTEAVYLDGVKLTRGEQNDYVINYNSGEVTFTPNILITQYSRIIVEFQYSDRNYARSVVTAEAQWKKKNLTSYVKLYTEQDLRNQPFQQSLDGFDSTNNLSAIDILGAAGDDPNLATIQRITPQPEYTPDIILYTKKSIGAMFYFEYVNDAEEQGELFTVVFTEVGANNGDYIQSATSANGRVYQYLGPGLGNFAPVEVLVAPKKYRMISAGNRLVKKKYISGWELATSLNDLNTFSTLDAADDVGYGGRVYWQPRLDSLQKNDSMWHVTTTGNLEWKQRHFAFIERYRSVEFERKWNRGLNNPILKFSNQRELISNIEMKAGNGIDFNVNYRVDGYQNNTIFQGLAHQWSLDKSNSKYRVAWSGEQMISSFLTDTVQKGNDFGFTSLLVSRTWGHFQIGGKGRLERSRFNLQNTDSLGVSSYGYQEGGIFLKREVKKSEISVGYDRRQDDRAFIGDLSPSTLGHNYAASWRQHFLKSSSFKMGGVYRTVEVVDTANIESTDDVLQGRIELNLNVLKRALISQTFYEIANGQEQRREFQYLEVQPGNGVYVWNDYDSNQVQTLDEFEIASILDQPLANYIRVFVPVQGFIQSRSNQFSQTVQFRPKSLLKQKKSKFWKTVKRLSTASTWRLQQKVIEPDLVNALNPFRVPLQDTGLLNVVNFTRQTLFINRNGSAFSGEVSVLNNTTKSFLTTGFDTRAQTEYIYKARVNLFKSFTAFTNYSQGTKSFSSAFNSNRNFDYVFQSIAPELSFQPNRQGRFSVVGRWFEAKNADKLGGERLLQWNVGLKARYGLPQNGSIQTEYQFISNDFNGESGTALSYELMNGLQNGNNHTWMLNVQRQISKGIQISISYEGRKSPDVPVVHIGRAQARYLF